MKLHEDLNDQQLRDRAVRAAQGLEKFDVGSPLLGGRGQVAGLFVEARERTAEGHAF